MKLKKKLNVLIELKTLKKINEMQIEKNKWNAD